MSTPVNTTTPPSDTSTDKNQSPRHHAMKKRKPTYLVRKEEQKALQEEIEHLETEVTALLAQRMPTGEAVVKSMQQEEAQSKGIQECIRNQQLGVAAAQSLMLECARTQYCHPLWSRICLKKDWSERRAILLAIREAKLQNGYNYIMARCPYRSDGRDWESSEKFETDEGDICLMSSSVIHFPGVDSLEQVFQALCFYINNMEISISERLGHITVREDYDVIEGSAFNSRIISSDGNGVSIETNSVGFTQLFSGENPSFGGEPCGIAASDCVDEDELYPYHESERVRKDISGAIVLSVCRQKDSEDGKVVVVMRRTGMLKLHRPELSLSPFAQQELEDGIADWGNVMIETMREVLYSRA
ncbi:hypothetical protein V7S43_017322 [Phytophthora oleae]|uniref:Uncharacterized protein n=1 Tax=Phytophthora oleae TaxID=2107226 RepID=A0ABD3ETC4_9STRA